MRHKKTIIQNKVVHPKYYDSIVPQIEFTIKDKALYKNRLMMLDIVNENNWKRWVAAVSKPTIR